jgi:hypothetical protein
MAYREANEHVLTVAELSRSYPIRPVGTLTYYGVVEENVRYFERTGRALQPKHRSVIDDLLAALYTGYADELTFQLVLEPTQNPQGYDFALRHLDLIRRLAAELSEYPREAAALGKHLELIVRFGSEMNDIGGTAGTTDVAAFIDAFRGVRKIFSDLEPGALFPFSPALRADLEVGEIEAYWPGDEFVDLVGATWYVHGEAQQDPGLAHMSEYFRRFIHKGKDFSLDEFGGAEGEGQKYYDNDRMLSVMLRQVDMLVQRGVEFKFGTIFLDEEKYGVDATLEFIGQ